MRPLIRAEHFHDETHRGVRERVKRHLFPGDLAPGIVPEQRRVDRQQQCRLEELARVERQRRPRRPDQALRHLLPPCMRADRIRDAERPVRARAEAASLQKATHAPQRVPHRQRRHEEVQEVQVVFPMRQGEHRHRKPCADQSTVEHQPPLVQVQHLPRRPRELRTPVLDHVRRPRSAEPRHDQQRQQVRHVVPVAARSAAEVLQRPQKQQKADGHAHAVPMNFESA